MRVSILIRWLPPEQWNVEGHSCNIVEEEEKEKGERQKVHNYLGE